MHMKARTSKQQTAAVKFQIKPLNYPTKLHKTQNAFIKEIPFIVKHFRNYHILTGIQIISALYVLRFAF